MRVSAQRARSPTVPSKQSSSPKSSRSGKFVSVRSRPRTQRREQVGRPVPYAVVRVGKQCARVRQQRRFRGRHHHQQPPRLVERGPAQQGVPGPARRVDESDDEGECRLRRTAAPRSRRRSRVRCPARRIRTVGSSLPRSPPRPCLPNSEGHAAVQLPLVSTRPAARWPDTGQPPLSPHTSPSDRCTSRGREELSPSARRS